MSSSYHYKPNSAYFDRDLYGMLQVANGATEDVIKAAHRALSLKYAARSEDDDQTVAKDLNVARDILTDVDIRRDYDLHRQQKAEAAIGHYEISKLIAEGGHCDVYLATHALTRQPVVIKHCRGLMLDTQAILIEEAKTLSDIRHFAIPKFRDIFRLDDGSIVLVEDYISGPTLEELIRGCGPLEAETVCWIAARVLQILHYLHMHGVVHGDIKPSNLVIWPDEHQVFLVDFGLAMTKPSLKDKNKGYAEIYSPPEQQQKSRPRLVPQNDFYSLGMTMIFALSGDEDQTRARRVPGKNLTPASIMQFISWMTQANPDDRPSWNENLEAAFADARQQGFGRVQSGFKPIPDWRSKLGLAA